MKGRNILLKKIRKTGIIILAFIAHSVTVFSQGVGVGTLTPNGSSIMELSSTTKGMLLPRMTTTQRKAIPSPANGLLVYDLDKLTVYIFDGSKWIPLLSTTTEGKLPHFPVQASDGMAGDAFGKSVSINGDYAVIGASDKDVSGNMNQGGAYIFFRNGGIWTQQANLTSTTGGANDMFGLSVEMGVGGNEVVIGAKGSTVGANSAQGCAYIFKRNGTTWTQQAKLTASDGTANDMFGSSVSIDGNYVIIGASGDNPPAGSSYVFFKNSEWMDNQAFQAKIVASDASVSFGADVSISGDYAIAGAPNTANGVGSIYIFHRNGTAWTQQAEMLGAASFNLFGTSVSIDGDYVVAGVPFGNSGKGGVNIYYRGSGWTNFQAPQASLLPSDILTGDSFGYDVCISGDYVLVGSPEHDLTPSGNEGASYLFKRNGTVWTLTRLSVDEDKQVNEKFGTSVSIQGNNMMEGIPLKNGKGEAQFINIE